ncbi:MAG: hypothetical protein V1800_17985 [Candidatus Latescibacterota bacterium]
MKQLMVVFAIVLAFGSMAIAYEPAGVTYYIGGIADANVPTIDGSVDDWAFMPRAYYFTGADFIAREETTVGTGMPGASAHYPNGEVAKDDFDIIAQYIGWAPSTNMYYIGVSVTDSELFFPNEDVGGTWQEDHIQFLLNANGEGGNFRTTDPVCSIGQQWYLTLDPRNAANPVGFFGAAAGQEWSWVPPFTFNGVQKSATGWSLEIGMALWDYLDVTEATSVRHTLTAGETFGGNVHIRDRDADALNDVGTTMNFADAWTDASLFAAFYMVDPITTGTVAVESSTWGSIKSTFSK